MLSLLFAMREYWIFFFGGLIVSAVSGDGFWNAIQPDPVAAKMSQVMMSPAISYGPVLFAFGICLGVTMTVGSVIKANRFVHR